MNFKYTIKLFTEDILFQIVGDYYTIKDGLLTIYTWDDEFEDVPVFSTHEVNVVYIVAAGRVDK